MATSAAVGTFNITTQTAGNTVAVTGVGFQPVAVLFWWNGRTESTDTEGSATIHSGIGVGISTSSRGCVGTFQRDGLGTSDEYRFQARSHCIAMVNTSSTYDGQADVSSMDSDGFTLVIDTQFTANLRIAYMAFGGDITDAVLGRTASDDVTGLSFAPKAVLFFESFTSEAVSTQSVLSLGLATGPANEYALTWFSQDGQATTNTNGYGYGDECFAFLTSPTINQRAHLDSLDADGFSRTVDEGTLSEHFYLALGGADAQLHVGDFATPTDTSNLAITGIGFEPDAVLLASHCHAESTQDTLDADACLSLGAATSASNRFALVWSNQDNLGTTETYTGIEYDQCYIHPDLADGSDGLMDLVSMDSDGFTVVMDTAESARRCAFLAVAGTDAITVTAPVLTATWTTQSPTVTLTLSVTPNPITATWTTQSPTVTFGTLTVTAPALTATWTVQAATSGFVVRPAALSATWTVQAATVTLGTLSVTPAAITATWATQTHTVTFGAISVTAAVLTATWATQSPTGTVLSSFVGSVTGEATVTANVAGRADATSTVRGNAATTSWLAGRAHLSPS